MPAAAIVLPLIETVVAPIVAPIVSSALAATGVTALSSAAATSIATSALVGAGGGALVAAAQGQDVGQGALMGAIGSAAAPVLGNVVAPQVTQALGKTGQTTLSSLANNTILGATTVADVATGAIVSSGTAAAQAALQGGDVGKAALGGLVGGAVAPVVSGALDAALGGGKPTYTEDGRTSVAQGPEAPPQAFGSIALGGGLVGGITPLISGTLAGTATGLAPETAFKRSIPSAIGGGLSRAAMYGLGLDTGTTSALGKGITSLARETLPSTMIDRQQPSYPTYQATAREAAPSSMTGGRSLASAGGPSATLGQSLSIAPTLGYSPGGTVFGVGGEGDTPKRRVWNVASLRNIGEEV